MRLDVPRIQCVDDTTASEEQTEILSRVSAGSKNPGASAANVFRTVVNHPKYAKRWMVFANHILFKSSLPERDREILILRIGWLCQSGYELAQHKVIGLRCGMTEDEMDGIKQGADAPMWSEFDRFLIKATDELHGDAFISDDTWNALRQTYSEEQMVDLVGTVGNYNLVSMMLNSFGVQLDEGLEAF